MPHLTPSEVRKAVKQMQLQRRKSTIEEVRKMRSCGMLKDSITHVVLVELKGACLLVKQLTGSAPLALALASLESPHQEVAVPGELTVQLSCQRYLAQPVQSGIKCCITCKLTRLEQSHHLHFGSQIYHNLETKLVCKAGIRSNGSSKSCSLRSLSQHLPFQKPIISQASDLEMLQLVSNKSGRFWAKLWRTSMKLKLRWRNGKSTSPVSLLAD